jgi:hypothetical protein
VTDEPATTTAPAARSGRAFPPDPHVEHLLRLLAILPGSQDVAFWNQVDAHGLLPDAEAGAEDLVPSGHGYLLNKLTGYIHAALEPDVREHMLESLAAYVLMFFWGDHPGLWKTLDRIIPARSFASDGGFGRRYAQDLCDAAWTVAVRYHSGYRADADALLAKWPADCDGNYRGKGE